MSDFLVIAVVHTVRITLFHNPILTFLLVFLGAFVVIRAVIRVWDLIAI